MGVAEMRRKGKGANSKTGGEGGTAGSPFASTSTAKAIADIVN